ncbi:hypothetical protein Tco_0401707 [Tanacetum coccineum]
MMEADYELCKRLQEQEQGELTIEEKSKLFVELMNERKRHFARLRAEEKRRKPLTKAQKRNQICTYLNNMGGFTHNQLKNKNFEEIQKAFDKTMSWINSFKPMDFEEEAYQTFADMLMKFDRAYLVKLWDLVKERFSSTEPIDDKERELWVELKRLFEPDSNDLLELQRWMHDPLTWKLYDTCGVHHVSSPKGYDIFMLVEKDYPLTRDILTLMLVCKLMVDQPFEMENELLRKIFILANRPRQGGLLGIKSFYNLMLLVQHNAAG